LSGHEFTQQSRQVKFVSEFKCDEQVIQWWLVAKQGVGTVEAGRVLLALSAYAACV
jgi:hypothetical protein